MAKDNTKIGFEEQIWNAACVLWGHIPATEYRKVIIGLIFLRYISSAFERRYDELVKEGDGFENDKDAYTEENIFFVPEEARWSKISAAAHTSEIGMVIDEAMRAIEKENRTLKNVLPKNYGSPDLDKRVLGEVVDLFTNEVKMDGTEKSKDLLGRTYEYCIAKFAEHEGVKGGVYMIHVWEVEECSFRVQTSYKNIVEIAGIFLYMDKNPMQIHGKWQK